MSITKHLTKRGYTKYSRKEYLVNTQKSMKSNDGRGVSLKVSRPDGSDCTLNLLGYPLNPMPQLHAYGFEGSEFLKQT